MNESNSHNTDPKKINTGLDLFYDIKNSALPNIQKPKNTVVKYTKLPNFDCKVSWPYRNYLPQPRLRRIVTLEDQQIVTNRSLQPNSVTQDNIMYTSYPKRKIKIITITDSDNDGNAHHYKQLSKDLKKSACRTSNKVPQQNYQDYQIEHSYNTVPQVTTSRKDPAKSKAHIVRSKDLSNISEIIQATKTKSGMKITKNNKKDITTACIGNADAPYNSKDTKKSRINLSKNIIESFNSEKDTLVIKQKLSDDLKCNLSNKSPGKVYSKKYQSNKKTEVATANKSTSLKLYTENQQKQTDKKCKMLTIQLDSDTKVNKMLISTKNVSVETDPLPHHISQITQCTSDSDTMPPKISNELIQTEVIKDKFDNLDVPNITLIEEKKNSNGNKEINYNSKSVPNLKEQKDDTNQPNDSLYNTSSSYIIGRATVTYTTEQKIDFHVVNKELHEKVTPSVNYPLNIVSIFKKETNRKCGEILDDEKKENHKGLPHTKATDKNFVGCCLEIDSNKIMKPSDIISTIRFNNSLIQSDYICEEFQRELNFINSFFESLQYLETLSEKCFKDVNMHSWTSGKQFEVNNSECDIVLTKFENGHNVDDTRTMATKSLCQLNLLIHNEQRRARDFLFVLKMQENVLKDYIKSQMLWLEKKKKQDNIDISALKKKQRGALLKLQHECGEMQRMRKALLTLSEKRKVALMKTKKNIEMKLKNNVDVEQIILGKKKLKRNTSYDRCLAPLKCFDLSSSGCEESTTSRAKSECTFYSTQTADALFNAAAKIVTSAEKSIQTSDSVIEGDLLEHSNTTAAENCVVVHGGYLNILFHNLSLPQIFSSGKQYEVNEEALRIIVQSSNTCNVLKDAVAIEKFMDQVKHIDTDDSSTDSTAHSLVEEFDQYFKCLDDEEKSLTNSPECETHNCMLRECAVQTNNEVNSEGVCDHSNVTMIAMDSDESMLQRLSGVCGIESSFECGPSTVSVDESELDTETMVANVGPLPVPAGAAAPVDAVQPASAIWVPPETSSNLDDPEDKMFSSNLTPSQFTSPAMFEAEELRRQQLAIEREIKALEQQQCQLLVVREIPDKPPPPYTPPMEARAPKPPRQFQPDDSMENRIRNHFEEHSSDVFDVNDPFEAFVVDFSAESSNRQRTYTSDKPWDDCNLLPQKSQPELKKIIENVTAELKEALSGVTPSYVSGVSSRRTDHIDDILFAEWRRYEPEWTSLHTDEATVKNQLFESIFQKILNEAVDDYKTILSTDKHSDD